MKKIKILVIFTLMFSLSGCIIKTKDITQLVFPITLMIAKQNNKYQIYMLVLSNSLSSKIELESGLDDTLYSLIYAEDDTISKASKKLGVVSNGNLSAIKIKSIILHSSLFENAKINYNDLTSYIINNPLYRTNLYVYYTNDDPDTIFNINSINFSTNTYFYLTRPDQKHLNDFLTPPKLLDTTKSYIDNHRMFYLPSLTMTTDQLKQGENGELKEVNTYSIEGAYFLTRSGDFKYVDMESIKGLKWNSDLNYFDIELGDENVLLNVKIEKLSWRSYIKNNLANVDIKVISKINYNYSDLKAKDVEEKLKEYIYQEVTSTYLTNYQDIDIYLFDDLSYRLKKKIEDNSTFNLNLDVTVKNTIYEY